MLSIMFKVHNRMRIYEYGGSRKLFSGTRIVLNLEAQREPVIREESVLVQILEPNERFTKSKGADGNKNTLYVRFDYLEVNANIVKVLTDEEHTCGCCDGLLYIEDDESFRLVFTRQGIQLWDTSCAERYVRTCEYCGFEENSVSDSWNRYEGLCSHCANETRVCVDCDHRDIEEDMRYDSRNGDWYCPSCFEEQFPDNQINIRGYSYKPNPIFYGQSDTNKFMGIELEVERKSGESRNSLEFLNDFEEFYFKEDGSLNNGFEIVTHPMTMDYHKEFAWESVLSDLVQAGLRSHKPQTCGLHVHVSRDAFCTPEVDDPDMGIGRLLFFVSKFQRQLIKLSRRRTGDLDSWAQFRHFESRDDEDAKQKAKYEKDNSGRYRAINLQNEHTIEFRFWRGTLKYNTFIASLQLTSAMVDIATNESIMSIDEHGWEYFVALYFDTPEIKQYLMERGM